MARNDYQCLQRMKTMVKATHWVKGDLKRVIEWEMEEEGRFGECKVDPVTGQMIPSKMGHCIMGFVAEVSDIDLDKLNRRGCVFEINIDHFPQASRITNRLFNAMISVQVNMGNVYKYPGISETSWQAYKLEQFNDNESTTRQDIIELIDRAMAIK